MSDADAVQAAADRLYAADPDDFTSTRDQLAKAAKADGDPDAAKAIGALRKPTVAASVVNRYALHDPSVGERLGELGDRMRRAQRDYDATQLRELSTERRALVAEVTTAAFAHVGRTDPPTGLREDVGNTFDAAVADPEVAGRLGRLLKPEQFSGFGVAPGPELTLVRATPGKGGTTSSRRRSASTTGDTAATASSPKAPRVSAASRRLTRTAERARASFTDADGRFAAAESAERDAQERVRTLTDELTALQRELDTAKHDLDAARKDTRSARTGRREAQSALDRAERARERSD